MREKNYDFYGGQDPREMAVYKIYDAAHYLHIPSATLRSWILGRYYPTKTGKRFFKPVILLPDEDQYRLSFMNLVEAHVLSAIRRVHKIGLPRVRVALEYLTERFHSKHPLADQEFETDGINLFVKKFGQLINLTESGQLAMEEVLKMYLRRIDRDSTGYPLRLYLFTRQQDINEPKVVVIDPRISFGRPVVAGTGITTATIAERYKAGESIEELSADYGLTPSEIQEAIRCELQLRAAEGYRLLRGQRFGEEVCLDTPPSGS
jgi:uncharacterized protein (DUF433 family)